MSRYGAENPEEALIAASLRRKRILASYLG